MKRVLSAFYHGWMAFAHALGRVQTFLLLTVVYFVAIGMLAPLVRLFSGDPLEPAPAVGKSVWVPKGKTNRTLEDARRLF